MPSLAGMTYLPHDKTFFGDRLIVPNQITPIFWTALPPRSVWSAPMFDADFISVGRRDDSLSESIRGLITALPGGDSLFEDGANDFIKQGYVDIQGWIITGDVPLTKNLTATPRQIIDDYIRKVPVPYVNPGQQLTADQQLQTLRETTGDQDDLTESNRTSAEGEENVLTPDNSSDGLATKHPAVIDQAAWYELGPNMFFETRLYLGTRHGNAIPVANEKQRYAAAIRTDIGGKATQGKYGVIIFTASMPHLSAMATPLDEQDDQISPYTDWDDMIMTYQRAPLEHFEMQDEISLANARYRFRQDMQNTAAEGDNVPQEGLWGVTGNYAKYIQDKRQYTVKQGMWEQKPLMVSMRINHTIHTPFQLIPNRM